MQSRDSVLLQYLVKGRNALTMASRDMASACEAGILGSPVVKDINQVRLKSAYNCSVYALEQGRGGQDNDAYAKYD